ncbi:MAG TPA: hypothetical protein VEV21_14960 [Burkholderiales bacterium]|nr:hypothetical protein [Burkholderiales bacterium]
MSKQLMLVGVVAAVLGGAIGYVAGLRTGAANDRSGTYIATAGHTKTYVSIARLLRGGNPQEALKLADAMIDVGASWLSPMPHELDAEAKTLGANALSAVEQYRQAR